jgi:uncharacterized protein (DUF427 family)
MSTRLRDVLMQELGVLRHEPIEKRIRATLGGETVVDSTRAMLVWEPRRVVPTYAVPEEDVRAEIAPAPAGEGADADALGMPAMGAPRLGDRVVLDPSVPFAVRSTEGEPLLVRSDGREAEAFRAADPDLDGYVIVDFAGFDEWFEEDERNVGHPRDPFHRIDIVHGSRHVRVELDGEVLAESSAPYLLFEPPLPVRYYLAPEDVRTDLLRPSDTRTFCAYKGQASYFSFGEAADLAWTYPAPLREAAEVTDRIAFFNERADVVVDGARLERPITPWSRR